MNMDTVIIMVFSLPLNSRWPKPKIAMPSLGLGLGLGWVGKSAVAAILTPIFENFGLSEGGFTLAVEGVSGRYVSAPRSEAMRHNGEPLVQV